MPRFSRRTRPAASVGAVALLAAACAVLAGCAGGASVAAPGPSIGQRLDAPLPPSVADAALQSSSGKWFTLGSLNKVVVISDMMTLCQESCPLDTANVVQAARDVDRAGLGDKVEFVSLTIDPARDTRPQLAAFRKLYSPAPRNWIVATARPSVLHALWGHLGVYIKKAPDKRPAPRNWRTGQPLTYDVTHSDEVFFVDRAGRERFLLEGVPHVAAGAPVPRTLDTFMNATGHKNLTNPSRLAWTLPDELRVLSWLIAHHIPTPSRN